MNRTTARRLAPALVALALFSGCSGEDDTEAPSVTGSPGASLNAAVCEGYDELQAAVEDLRATPLETTGTPEELQAQAAELEAKASTIKASLNKLTTVSDGPAAAAVGTLNQKADELRESLALAKAEAAETLGPEVTAAQEELNAAYDDLTAKFETVCPTS